MQITKACNIKNDSKSFYAYVRSKQNVRDMVGPLEDSAGNIASVQCLPERILVHYQFQMLNFGRLNLTRAANCNSRKGR